MSPAREGKLARRSSARLDSRGGCPHLNCYSSFVAYATRGMPCRSLVTPTSIHCASRRFTPSAMVPLISITSHPPGLSAACACGIRRSITSRPVGPEVIERLIPQAQAALKPGGWLVMEISGTIAEGVKRLLAQWIDVGVTKDLQGIPRVAYAT